MRPDDELTWSEDQQRARPDRDVLNALYDQYLAEGHLVMGVSVEDNRDGPVWIGRCLGCDATNWGSLDAAEAVLVTYPELKWWQRSHRTDHGLPWQEWMPAMALDDFRERAHQAGIILDP